MSMMLRAWATVALIPCVIFLNVPQDRVHAQGPITISLLGPSFARSMKFGFFEDGSRIFDNQAEKVSSFPIINGVLEIVVGQVIANLRVALSELNVQGEPVEAVAASWGYPDHFVVAVGRGADLGARTMVLRRPLPRFGEGALAQ